MNDYYRYYYPLRSYCHYYYYYHYILLLLLVLIRLFLQISFAPYVSCVQYTTSAGVPGRTRYTHSTFIPRFP